MTNEYFPCDWTHEWSLPPILKKAMTVTPWMYFL